MGKKLELTPIFWKQILKRAPSSPFDLGGKLFWRAMNTLTTDRLHAETLRRMNAENLRNHYEKQMKIAKMRVEEFHQLLDENKDGNKTIGVLHFELMQLRDEQRERMKQDEL